MKYPKLAGNDVCPFPGREECNYNENQERCKFMKYNNSKSIFDATRWECSYKSLLKDKQKEKETCVKD